MSHRSAPALVAVAMVAALSAGCVAAGSPAPSGSAAPPSPSTGFYLRAWTTQALPPASSFAVAARLVIADGRLIDTAVAVPAIYPGPLLIEPLARTISAHGIAAIEAELRAQGLLVTEDFTGGESPVGGVTGHLVIVVDGTTYTLTGDPTTLLRCGGTERCVPDPGTGGAFTVFWQKLTGDLDPWLGSDLGAAERYDLERLSILLAHPIETFAPLPSGATQSWPLAPFATFGMGYAGSRCGTVSGTDLATLLPILRRSNQLTTFVDRSGATHSLVLHPLLPGEPDVCASPAGGATPTPAPSPTSTGSPAVPTPSSAAVTPGPSSGSGGGTGSSLGPPTVRGLSCFGGGPVFQPSALSGPANAEQGTDGAAATLRALLATASLDTDWLPKAGWQRAAESADEVLFLAAIKDSDPPYAYATVAREAGSTTWKAGGWGQCRIFVQLSQPFQTATWTLQAATTADTTSFTALVSESSCASGQPPIGRISDPLIVYGDRTIAVTFGIVPLAGAQTCPGIPPSPVVVQLREPLGARQLADGGLYPPEPVEVRSSP